MRWMISLLFTAILAAPAWAQNNPLAVFEPLMGTWVGTSTDPDHPDAADIMRFEWILGGAAVQHTHHLEPGTYGGRTIYFFDGNENDGQGGIIYHYFTTAGFHTEGTAWWEDGRLVAHEFVTGLPDITEVQGYVSPTDAGWESSAEYLTDGTWVAGHGFSYVAAADEEVSFGGE